MASHPQQTLGGGVSESSLPCSQAGPGTSQVLLLGVELRPGMGQWAVLWGGALD